MRLIIFVILCICALKGYALESLPVSRSLIWQGQMLEEQISKKIRSSLGTIVSNDQVIVDVKIDMQTPEEYNPEDGDNGGGDSGGGGADNESKDQNKNSKGKVKFVDSIPEEEPGHYILFSKLGLEAPLIDDYKVKEDSSSSAAASPAGNSGGGQKKVSLKEQLKVDQKFDIFNNLDEILIKVYLDERTPEPLRQQVQTILNSINFNFGTVIPKIALEFVKMSVVEKEEAESKLDLLKEFSTPITIIVSVIIFGLMLMAVAKKITSSNNSAGQSPSISIKNELPEREEDSSAQNGMGFGAGTSDGDSNSPRLDGIERFIAYYDKSPQDAILLIRKWIKSDSKQSVNALRALVQEMDNHTLADIFSKIDVDDREAWKRSLDQILKDHELSDSKMFIGGQIVEEIMNSGNIDDTELCELLLEITPQQAVELVKNDVDISKLLLNISSPVFINSIISELNSDDLKSVAQHATDFDYDGIKSSFDKIKESLRGQLDARKYAPFIRQLFKLFPDVEPQKEHALLQIINESCDDKAFMNLVCEYCPYDALTSLPSTFLKGVLEDYELKHKVPFLLSLPEKERDFYVSIFAPEGSRARDLIGLEMNARSADKQFIAEVESSKSEIHKSFLTVVRKEISRDTAGHIENEMALKDWAMKSFQLESDMRQSA